MKKLILFFSFLFLITESFSQDLSDTTSTNKTDNGVYIKPKIYKTNILTYGKSKFIKGYLVNLSDSGVALSSSPVPLNLEKNGDLFSVYNYDQLRQVTVRRKASTVRGLGYGALIGFGIGAIAGLASGDDPSGWFAYTAEQKAIVAGVLGIPVGAVIGVIAGAVAHKTFIIGGSKDNYKAMRESLLNK